MTIVQGISCSTCGAPMHLSPGEIISTCRYCGYTQVVQTGKAFTFEHSMLLNGFTTEGKGRDGASLPGIEKTVAQWMSTGFTKPSDLARSSNLRERKLVYLPFWVIDVNVETSYKGVFERLQPPVVKNGQIKKHYDWLILARRASEFPVREYDVPLEGKIPFDFRKIEDYAEVLNSELERDDAMEKAEEEITALHEFHAKQDVDKILEIKTAFHHSEAVYLHSPIWFITYEYKGKTYKVTVDGAKGTVITGDLPPVKLGLL
ncbi:MAG: hypothetical protein JSV35_06545 [Candidatus Bathyarchaeota archaeon]|nr:MAG: hypothetical protein JSV35_06545 [Candidatus Bathyarchaeota archaeon]